MTRNHTWCLLSILLFAAIFCPSAHGADAYYVDPGGDDANPGTLDAPFRTIARAQEVVRTRNAAMTGDIVVHLRGGAYALDEPLRFDHRDSGQGGHDVVYKATPGAMPALCGGRRIDAWQEDADGRWKAKVPDADFRQLYVNGVRAQRARGPFPDGAERYGDLKFIDADAGFTLPGHEALADWRNPQDIEFGFYNSWSHMICKVDAIARSDSGVKIAMQQPTFFLASRKEGVQAQIPDYIENAFELLDEPGEWYLDKPAGVLYYIPRENEDMASVEVVAPVLETLLELAGTLDAPVHNLRFEGIAFADATWLRPNRRGHADVQANFVMPETNLGARGGTVYPVHNEDVKSPANVRLHAAKSIRFERCTFTRLGGMGLDIEYGSQDNVVSGCRFYDVSGTAIQVGDVQTHDHHPWDERLVVKNNRVVNNYIHHCGAEFQDSIGVFAGYTQGTVIAHNEICNLPYSGISAGWGWGEEDSGSGGYAIPYKYVAPTPAGGNRIEANHIHHVMLLRNDGGGVYTLSNQPGTIILGNHIHDNGEGGGPGGIYLDEGSGFIEITGNCVYNVPRAMNYNNRVQGRIETCNEHDNYFDIKPGDPGFPQAAAESAGLQPDYRDLLTDRMGLRD